MPAFLYSLCKCHTPISMSLIAHLLTFYTGPTALAHEHPRRSYYPWADSSPELLPDFQVIRPGLVWASQTLCPLATDYIKTYFKGPDPPFVEWNIPF